MAAPLKSAPVVPSANLATVTVATANPLMPNHMSVFMDSAGNGRVSHVGQLTVICGCMLTPDGLHGSEFLRGFEDGDVSALARAECVRVVVGFGL